MKDRLKQKIQAKVEQKTDSAADAALGHDAKTSDTTATASAQTPAAEAKPAAPPGQGAWLNYDFVPGNRTIMFEDFSGNEVGDFPRRFRLQEGNLEVVKINGAPMLRSADGGSFYVKLPERLPPRFTVELRFHSPGVTNPIYIRTTASSSGRSADLGCYPTYAFVEGNEVGPNSGNAYQSDAPTGFVDCTFTVDNGRGIKGYIGEHRTANAPQDSVVLSDTLFFQLPSATADDPLLLATVRVAAGGKKLYDVLAASGRVATHGIFFDVGSDRLRPESTPTLTEIGEMLKQHPDLKLTIEGHTDDVGSAAANQMLSGKRAAAVQQYLVSTFGIAPARLSSVGFGASKPAAPNTTAEGRQNNRRVELVKR